MVIRAEETLTVPLVASESLGDEGEGEEGATAGTAKGGDAGTNGSVGDNEGGEVEKMVFVRVAALTDGWLEPWMNHYFPW